MRNRTVQTAFSLLLGALAAAALPAGAATLAIEGGRVHTPNGPVEAATVLIEGGTIRAVGTDVAVPEGATRLDAAGLDVYPGFFDALSQTGLVEIGSVPATVDTSELGTYNPHLRATTAVHPASELIAVTRATGITHTVVAPGAGDGVVAGQAALIDLDGWTVEEMTVRPDVAMVIAWPEVRTRSFDFATFTLKESPFKEAKKEAEKQQAELAEWLQAARHYAAARAAGSERLERDLKLEALAGVLEGRQRVVIQANRKADIEAAVAFAEKEGLAMVLAGGRDAWEVAELLAEKEIPVILGRTQALPAEEDDPYDRPFGNAARLAEAGVTFAWGSTVGGGRGGGGAHSARTLPFEAGMAVAYGLDAEAALAALTVNPARIFGMEDRFGSIEPGKAANLVVTDGDPLEITTQVRHLVVEGREVSTDNRHEALYRRYRSRGQ